MKPINTPASAGCREPGHAATLGARGGRSDRRRIGLRGDRHELHRRPREIVVRLSRRQHVERFPRLIEIAQLLAVVGIRGQPLFDAAAIVRRQLAVEIGHQLFRGRLFRMWIDDGRHDDYRIELDGHMRKVTLFCIQQIF